MMKEKKLLFSLTRKDFELETFTVGGHGGGSDTSIVKNVKFYKNQQFST